MPALRLLDDHDFAQLRIPDAARRRIAEALQSVQILDQIEGSGHGGDACRKGEDCGSEEMLLVQTQPFATSRLREERGRSSVLVEHSDGDDEFNCSSPMRTAAESRDGHQLGAHRDDEQSDALGSGTDDLDSQNLAGDRNPSCAQRTVEEEAPSEGRSSSSNSEDVECSDASSLYDIELRMMSTSQISLETKLEKWLRRQVLKERGNHRRKVEKEKERHKREMEVIQQRYERMQKRICSSRNSESNVRSISRVTVEASKSANDLSMSLAPLQSEAPAAQGNGNSPEADPCPSVGGMSESSALISPAPLGVARTRSPISFSTGVVVDDRICMQKRPSSAIDLTLNTSEDENRAKQTPAKYHKPFPNPTAAETIVISSSKPSAKPALRNPAPCHNSGELPLPYQSDQASLDSPNQSGRSKLPQYERIFASSDEEVMDLTFLAKENVAVDDSLTESVSATVANRAGNGNDAGSPGEVNNEDEHVAETTQNTSKPSSRLKKRTKRVTPADVIEAIRRDSALHDDLLMMESVPFEKILGSVKASGVKISKKALAELLQREGVSFKSEEVNEKQKAGSGSYFQRLNCDSD